MKYSTPGRLHGPTDAQVDEFLRITDDPANRPMFITAPRRSASACSGYPARAPGRKSEDAALEEAKR